MYKFSKETPLIGYFENQNLIEEKQIYFYFDIDFVVSNIGIKNKNIFSNELYFSGKCSLGIHKKEVFYLLDRYIIPSLIKYYSPFNEVKINFISYDENEMSNISRPKDQFDLKKGKINIFVTKETIINILSNLKIDNQNNREKLGTIEIMTDSFSSFYNYKTDEKIVCICEKKWIDQGMFSNKDGIKLLRPDQEITSWSINFLNIFDIKQNRGIFKNFIRSIKE